MANIALIDLPADTLGSLAEQHTVRVYKTRWNGGQEDLNLADGTQLVFINATYGDLQSLALHTAVHQMSHGVVDRSGAVFVFVGRHCTSQHIRNLVGMPAHFQLAGTPDIAALCFVADPSPLDVVFSRFCNRIISSTHLHAPDYPGNPYKTREILRHESNVPTGLLIEKGLGRCVYLPDFGDAVGLVVQSIIRDVLPALLPHLVEDPQFRWLNETRYLMPSLARIRMEQQEAMRVHEETQHRLGEQWTAEWTSTQTPWNELLTSTGDALKKAVQLALEALGVNVVDVDEYWKQRDVERQKEEDLWLGFGASADPAVAGTVLAEVKSSRRGTASEDDYGAVIKYINRRKSEFRNFDLTGMLIINHSYAREAALRPPAFTETMMSDAVRDGVVLATTWDLFRLGQRFLAGDLSATDVRGFLCKPGLLTVP